MLPQEHVFSFENMGFHYFLKCHTTPQAALDFRLYFEHSKRIPAASDKGESPSDYFVLAGVAFSTHQLRKAFISETASISTKYGGMTDASIALVKYQQCAFTEAAMGLHCAFCLRAPFVGQLRLNAEGMMTLHRFVLGKNLIPRETGMDNSYLFRCGHAKSCSSTTGRPCISSPSRLARARRRSPS